MTSLRLYASEIEEKFGYNPLAPDFLGDGEQIAEFDSNNNEVTFCYHPDSATIEIAYGNLGYGCWDMLPEELIWSFMQDICNDLAPDEANASVEVYEEMNSFRAVIYSDILLTNPSEDKLLAWADEINNNVMSQFNCDGALLGFDIDDMNPKKMFFIITS